MTNMIDKLEICIQKSNIVSFDIFDTLLLRPYIQPKDVFEEIEIMYSVNGFAAARCKAEPLAWHDLTNKNKDDVSLDEIYDYMPKEFQKMKLYEIAFESSHLYVNPEMLEVLNYAMSLNKQIIIVSDMYLSSMELMKILVRELKTDKFKLYVSSEFGKRKSTGRLFEHVLKDLNVKASEILHIGDNKTSDFQIPKSMGLGAFLYPSPHSKIIEDKRVAKFIKSHDNLMGRRFIGTLSLMYEIYRNKGHKEYWDVLGFLYGGPLAYNYVKMISDTAKTENLSTLCFVARDGYTLEKVFNIISPKSEIETKYVYAPRFTNTLAYIDLGNEKVSEERRNVLIDFLIKSGGAKPGDSIELHMQELKKFADIELREYKKYIHGLNLSKSVGVIDSISMSYSAQKLITKLLPDSDICGFYWWTIPTEGQPQPKLYKFYNGVNPPCFCHLIEFFFAAPEKPIYRIVNGEPLYKESVDIYEQIKIDLYPQISKAMIKFAEIAVAYNLNPILNDEMMFDWINYFVKFADKNDFTQFKNIKNGIDQSHTVYRSVLPEYTKTITIFDKFRHFFYKKTKSGNGLVRIFILGIRIIKYRKTK